MVWFDDKGRTQLCEATFSGHLVIPPIGLSVTTCSGFKEKDNTK